MFEHPLPTINYRIFAKRFASLKRNAYLWFNDEGNGSRIKNNKKMKNSIETLMNSYASDNAEFAREEGSTISEIIIRDCEATDWNWFFSDEEIEEGITPEMIEEVREWLEADFDYIPE